MGHDVTCFLALRASSALAWWAPPGFLMTGRFLANVSYHPLKRNDFRFCFTQISDLRKRVKFFFAKIVLPTRKGFLLSIKCASRCWELGDREGEVGERRFGWPLTVPKHLHGDAWLLAAQGPWQGRRQASWPRTAVDVGGDPVAPTTSTVPAGVVATTFGAGKEVAAGCCWW